MFDADEGDFIGTVYDERKIFQKLDTVLSVIELFHFERVVADGALLSKVNVRKFSARDGKLFEGKLIEHFFAARRLPAFRRVRRKALDKFSQVGHFIFAPSRLIFRLLLQHLAHLIPKIVIAGKLRDLSVIDIADDRTHRIEKVAVVADDDDDVFKIEQKIFEPRNRFDIEAVRRFVEQQYVGISENRLREEDAHFLTFVQIAHRFVVIFFFETEAGKHLFDLIFRFVAAEFAELRFEFRRFDAVFFGKIRFRVDFVPRLRAFVELRIAHHHRFFDGIIVERKVVLLQNGHTLSLRHSYSAGIVFEFSRKHFQKSRFSGSVRADNAVAVARRKFHIDVFKQRLVAEFDTDIGYGYHSQLP